jgi:hypothetical protein
MKDNRFNLLSTQLKNTSIKTNHILGEEEQPEKLMSVGYTRMKRKYNDLDTYTVRTESRPLNNLGTSIFTKPSRPEAKPLIIPSIQFKEEKEKTTFSKPAFSMKVDSKVKSIDTLEKYFYMDERYIETDKNIGNRQNPRILVLT